MPKTRKDRIAEKSIKLKQPDRSAPSEKTLLQLADERNLFKQAGKREKQLRKRRQNGEENAPDDSDDDDDDEEDEEGEATLSPGMERFLEAGLWTSTLAMLHFTFDVFVHNQYAASIEWLTIATNTLRAWLVFFLIFYPLHPHQANARLVPGLPARYQHPLRQAIFFAMSCASGCFLIYVTNSKGYMYNMRRAPTLSCLWLWAVVELDLAWAVLSLGVAVGFVLKNGYKIT